MALKRKTTDENNLISKRCSILPLSISLTNKTLGKSSNSITDLDDHLLNDILNRLDFDDLSNVALINRRFNYLVYKYLGINYKDKMITIQIAGNGEWLTTPSSIGKFKFDNPMEFATFCGISGHLISKLQIQCAPSVMKNQYKLIENAIWNHCTKSLNNIEITTTYLPVLMETTETFSNVNKLELNGCVFSENLCKNFNAFFPFLRRLVLKDCKVFDSRCIETHFTCLEELIVFGKCRNRMVFTKANIKKLIEKNPQIRRLAVDFDLKSYQILNGTESNFELDYDFYRYVSEYLPKLKSLKVYGTRKNGDIDYDEVIEFENLRKLALFDVYNQTPDGIAPFTFKCLHVLTIKHLMKLTDDWVRFISMNEHITKLTVDIYGSYYDEDGNEIREQIRKDQLQAIFKWLTQLKELHLQAETVKPKDIIAVLWMRKSLKQIVLRDYFMVESIVEIFDQLMAKKCWIVDYDTQNLILNRMISQK